MKQLISKTKNLAKAALCHRVIYGALAVIYGCKWLDYLKGEPVEMMVLACYLALSARG